MNNDIQQPAPLNINQQPDLEPQSPPPQPGQQFKPETPLNQPKKSKKKIVLLILLLLVLVGGAAAAYFLYLKKDTPAPAAQTTNQKPQETVEATGPQALIYNGDNTSPSLLLSSLSLTEKTPKTYDTKDFSQVAQSDVLNEKVAVVAYPQEKQTQYGVFYSEDNGVSFTKVYETKPATAGQMEDQITSIKFSSDGKSLAMGLLPSSTSKNVVTELNLKDKTTNTLFTADTAGLFIAGYDGKQVIYTKGCYNCDGGLYNTIYSYNVSAKKESAIIKAPTASTLQDINLNPDFSQLSYLETGTTEGEVGPNPAGPYIVKTHTLASNKSVTVKTFGEKDKEIFVDLGYMPNGSLYYAADKTVYSLRGTEATDLFTTTKTLNGVHYVSDKVVIASIGDYQAFTVNKYDTEKKELSDILKGTEKTDIVGITSAN
jgi:uncharacterized membrane protein